MLYSGAEQRALVVVEPPRDPRNLLVVDDAGLLRFHAVLPLAPAAFESLDDGRVLLASGNKYSGHRLQLASTGSRGSASVVSKAATLTITPLCTSCLYLRPIYLLNASQTQPSTGSGNRSGVDNNHFHGALARSKVSPSVAKVFTVARVLCTGIDEALLQTRRMLLEQEGHVVASARSEDQVRAACAEHPVDVAVIGQTVSPPQKRRILSLVRQFCPSAKVLELYQPHLGKTLDAADDWLEVPADLPRHFATHVTRLAEASPPKRSRRRKA